MGGISQGLSLFFPVVSSLKKKMAAAAGAAEETIFINVKSLGRRTTKYPKKDQPDLTAKTTVQDLTELVALSEGVPANQLRLVYKGKQLESGTEQTLEEAGLFAAAIKSSNKTVGVSVILALR